MAFQLNLNDVLWNEDYEEPVKSAAPTDQTEPISIRFKHGIGDACNMAQMLPLWIRRGWAVEVECFPRDVELFRAAGATITAKAKSEHVFGYPPPNGWPYPPQQLTPDNPTEWNKVAHNLDRSPVMPFIGTRADLWPELLDVKLSLRPFLSEKSRAEIDAFLGTVDGRVVLVHSRGTVSHSHVRPFTPELEQDVYRELLDQTDATIFQLDFDGWTTRFPSRRFRHLLDDFRPMTAPEVSYLMERAALFIGCDSGPAHLTHWTNTPALVVWFGNHPALHALPREKTLNLCDTRHRDLNAARRHLNHIVEVPKITGAAIVHQAAQLLDGRKPREVVYRSLLKAVGDGKAILAALSRPGPVALLKPSKAVVEVFKLAGKEVRPVSDVRDLAETVILIGTGWERGRWADEAVPALLRSGWKIVYAGSMVVLEKP